MKKILIFLLLFMLVGCTTNMESLDFSYDEVKVINIGEMTRLETLINDEWVSEDDEIITISDDLAYAVGPGLTQVKSASGDKNITFYVTTNIKGMTVTGQRNLKVGEEVTFNAAITPTLISQEVTWESLDNTIATVDNGKVVGVSEGLVTIRVTSCHDPSYKTDFQVLVTDNKKPLEMIVEEIVKEEVVNINNQSGYFYPLAQGNYDTVVGISNYNAREQLQAIGSGVIYKRVELENTAPKTYQYFVITNRHVIKNARDIKIHTASIENEIDATLVEYDDQIDLAVVTFISNFYFPIIKVGNSDQINAGEIIMTIGHPRGYDYFNSITLGIISYPKRYMSTDTDEDGVTDWDAEYIQHDAAINAGNSGGPVINLKGEVIGINTEKINSYDVDNMGFAIPINLAMEIASLLERGQKPQRAKLGVTVISVKDILISRAAYAAQGIVVPDEYNYGFYVNEVSTTGIAYLAGIVKGDIILTFNNVPMAYSHILRAEISKFIIGSGDVVPMEVYRQGVKITLYVTF